MVKLRGIEICIVSQFDIRKLPESCGHFLPPVSEPYPDGGSATPLLCAPTASCHIPVYPGSQFWFEYAIDGPHPPGSAYFFKLFINDKAVTAWDCTAKHGFHGKMMYNLVDPGFNPVTCQTSMRRQALRFRGGPDVGQEADLKDDSIQINVHRIEHRQRVRGIDPDDRQVIAPYQFSDTVQSVHPEPLLSWTGLTFYSLTDSGFLELGRCPRRYKYQLLDPVDIPYAVFRFSCHANDYLLDQGSRRTTSSPFSSSSIDSCTSGTVVNENMQETARGNYTLVRETASALTSCEAGPEAATGSFANSQGQNVPLRQAYDTSATLANFPLSESDDSLSVKAKDSIEEMQLLAARSPNSQRSPSTELTIARAKSIAKIPPSPPRSSRPPRHRLRKKKGLNTDGALPYLDRRECSSNSTAAGNSSQCGPSKSSLDAVFETGLPIKENLAEVTIENKPPVRSKECPTASKSSGSERGGKSLKLFLGRKLGPTKTDAESG